VLYATTTNGYEDGAVTFVDASRPTAVTNPFPMNFDAAKTALIAMSNSLRDHYEAKGEAVKAFGALTFTGTDLEFNDFRVTSDKLVGTTSYSFKVPTGSVAIVTVMGANPAFTSAGFGGSLLPKQLLWNFPEATTLKLNSVGFPGSILAPNAAADLRNGSIAGTVVVKSADPANVELYSAPFQLACTGGLCLDKTWSCSSDTAMADDGTAAAIASEAGFLEIEGGAYKSEGQDRISPKHRVWYSFHPAKFGRKNKPLAVFFQGGPGGGTTPYLFAFGTGPYTFNINFDPIDSRRDTLTGLVSNPNSWTQFANLLYIDAPATGFSYPLTDDKGNMLDIGTDMDRDAGNFLRVIVRFLARHPALQNNRVILVGESYGGTRAILMLQYLFDYQSLTKGTSAYQDWQLSDDLNRYFGVALGPSPSAENIATKFGHQVLIEPGVVGQEQQDRRGGFPFANCLSSTCMVTVPGQNGNPDQLPTCDVYNCDKRPSSWSSDLEMAAATNLTQVAKLNVALGVDSTTIEWMKASARKNAYGRANVDSIFVHDTTDMNSIFGGLVAGDSYLVLLSQEVGEAYGSGTATPARTWSSPGAGALSGTDFVRHPQNGVATFITVAKHDWVIWSPSIAFALEYLALNDANFGSLVSGAGYSDTYPTDISARPGAMEIYYSSGATRFITMPTYDAGHSVTMRKPAELLADVMQWYKDSPH
jgi:choice-of-anchor A domain-containing protein